MSLSPSQGTLAHLAFPSPQPLIRRPGILPRRYDVVVLGDVRIDIRAALRRNRFADIDTDTHEQVPIEVSVGGTAMGFARPAVRHVERVTLLGAVGRDSWTTLIRQACAEPGLVDRLIETARPNGSVVMLRDRPTGDAPEGVRLLVAQSPAPYDDLDPAVVRAAAADIESGSALVVDGYALLSASSAAAVEVATALAADARVPIGFDIVPHRIDERLTLTELMPLLERSSLVWVEADTLARLLRPAAREAATVRTAAEATALVESLPESLAGRHRTWFVRFGLGNMEETVAIAPGHHRMYYRTGYAQAAVTTGFGYVAAAAELKWWLTNLDRAAIRYPVGARRWRSLTAQPIPATSANPAIPATRIAQSGEIVGPHTQPGHR